jgi:hypothetical protein
MGCPDFANIDQLLDQLQARWLFAIELGTPTDRGNYHALFRIAFGPTAIGMQFSIATIRHGMVGRAMYFNPSARLQLKQQIAVLIEDFEEPDPAVVRLRERLGNRETNALTPTHHLYPVVSQGRGHSAR